MTVSLRFPSRRWPALSKAIGLGFVLVLLGGTLPALEARVGVVGSPPGMLAGEAVIEAAPEWFPRSIKAELGLELGWAEAFRLLVPVGPSWEAYLDDGWGWGAAVHALGGYQAGTSPVALWGGEAEVRTEYSWVPGLALGLTVGVRYVGNHWEFPLNLLLEVPLGPEDPLELGPDRDADEGERK